MGKDEEQELILRATLEKEGSNTDVKTVVAEIARDVKSLFETTE